MFSVRSAEDGAVKFCIIAAYHAETESFGAISRVLMKLEAEHNHWRS